MSATFDLVVKCCSGCKDLLAIEDGPIAAWAHEVSSGAFGPKLTCTECGCVKKLVPLSDGLAAEDCSPPRIDGLDFLSAPGGDHNVIRGHRLADPTTLVYFGSNLAPIEEHGADWARVTIPEGEPGSVVQVTVHNKHGARAGNSVSFTYP